jgi:O-antigen/teichoic acid export membrane protein
MTSLTILVLRSASLAAKFAITVFIARFIGLDALGLYGMIVGIVVIVPVVAGFGLFRVISRNAVTQSPHEITEAVTHYWLLQAVLYVVGFIAIAALGAALGVGDLGVLVLLIVALEHVCGDQFMLLTHLRRPLLASTFMFMRTAVWIFAYIALAFAFPELRNLDTVLIFWLGGCLVAVVGFIFVNREWPWGSVSFSALRVEQLLGHFRKSRMIYLNDISNSVGQYFDRYLVGFFLGLELTGVYVLFWSIGNALSNLISSSVILVAEPDLIQANSVKDADYGRLTKRLIGEATSGAVVLALATGVLAYYALPYIDRPLVVEWLPVLWVVLLGFVVRMFYEAQGSTFYSQHRDELTLFSGLLVLGTSIIANLALLPTYALYGSFAAVVISYSVGAIGRHVMIGKYCR